MQTDDNNTATDLVNFQSGVNLAYSLAFREGNPLIIQTINTIAKKNPQISFCKGITKGFEKALLDPEKAQQSSKNKRVGELINIQKQDRVNKDMER